MSYSVPLALGPHLLYPGSPAIAIYDSNGRVHSNYPDVEGAVAATADQPTCFCVVDTATGEVWRKGVMIHNAKDAIDARRAQIEAVEHNRKIGILIQAFEHFPEHFHSGTTKEVLENRLQSVTPADGLIIISAPN